jgi:putative transposase
MDDWGRQASAMGKGSTPEEQLEFFIAKWTVQQLREAFPWETAPRYLLRDRDQIFGKDFVNQVKVMGITQVLSTPRSPWQRAYVYWLIGTIRRDCLDQVIVFHDQSLRRHLRPFVDY